MGRTPRESGSVSKCRVCGGKDSPRREAAAVSSTKWLPHCREFPSSLCTAPLGKRGCLKIHSLGTRQHREVRNDFNVAEPSKNHTISVLCDVVAGSVVDVVVAAAATKRL